MITRIGRRVQKGRGFWAKANKICFTDPAPDKKVQCFNATGYETGARRAVRKKARGNWGAVGKTPKRVKPLTLIRSGAGRWEVATRTPGVVWKNMGMTPVGNPQRPTPLSTVKKKQQRKRRQ